MALTGKQPFYADITPTPANLTSISLGLRLGQQTPTQNSQIYNAASTAPIFSHITRGPCIPPHGRFTRPARAIYHTCSNSHLRQSSTHRHWLLFCLDGLAQRASRVSGPFLFSWFILSLLPFWRLASTVVSHMGAPWLKFLSAVRQWKILNEGRRLELRG